MSQVNIDLEKGGLPLSKAIYILVGSLLLGILFNILFYDRLPTLSIFLFVLAFYIFFIINFKDNITLKPTSTNILIIFILLLSANYTIHSNLLFFALNILVIPTLIASQTILFTNKNLYNWYHLGFIGDLLYGIFHGVFAYIFKPVTVISRMININSGTSKHTTVKKVAVGILVSLPLLFIVVGLLSSADDVFRSIIDNFSNIFINLKIDSFVAQFLRILIMSILIFSYMWSLSLKKKRSLNLASEAQESLKMSLDPVIALTMLVIICLVYCVFVFIQFTYLFGNILPSTLTYAEYARKGFFELVLVTLINLTILIVNINFTNDTNATVNKTLRFFNSFLVICTFVMLFSAHFRMTLYERMYGYTYLRFFTHSFMLYIFVLLLVTLTKIWYKKMSLAKFYIIISLLAYTMINYVNADKLIANQNLERYHKTGKIDIRYMTTLSYDAVPQMLSLYEELKIKDKITAAKLENLLYNKKVSLKEWSHWQSYNYSANKAKKLFEKYTFPHNVASDSDDSFMP